jgi:hypothetical protein
MLPVLALALLSVATTTIGLLSKALGPSYSTTPVTLGNALGLSFGPFSFDIILIPYWFW